MWRVSMTVNCASIKRLLLLTSSPPPHRLQGQIHSHTHYIHFSLDIPAGGICSLLRNNWHSEREYTAGIWPSVPPPLRGQQNSGLAGGNVPRPSCSRPTHTYQPHWGLQVQEWTSPPVCTTSLSLLMIGRLDVLFEQTLTGVISLQICRVLAVI